VDFFVFGDLGTAQPDGWNMHLGDWRTTVKTIHSIQKDLNDATVDPAKGAAIFHIGDISYARGYATMWESFFHQISNISSSAPWMTTDGNHERDYPNSGSLWTGEDSGGECGVPLNKRFTMPHENIQDIDEQWWSLNHGAVHWIVISTEHEFKEGSPQYNFVAADLAKVNRAVTPFLFLAGHRPAVAYGMMDNVSDALRKAFEPLMLKYKIDVAFWGHQHAYQRSCPFHDMQCHSESDGSGTIHFVTGAPGAAMSPLDPTKKPAWALVVEAKTHGYMRGHVRDGNTLTLEYVYNDDPTKVIDSIVIKSKFNEHGTFLGKAVHDLVQLQ